MWGAALFDLPRGGSFPCRVPAWHILHCMFNFNKNHFVIFNKKYVLHWIIHYTNQCCSIVTENDYKREKYISQDKIKAQLSILQVFKQFWIIRIWILLEKYWYPIRLRNQKILINRQDRTPKIRIREDTALHSGKGNTAARDGTAR